MAIDIGLVAGVSMRSLAERFAPLRYDAIRRHSENHLTPAQRAALLSATQPSAIDADQLAETERAGLLGHVVAQRARLLADADTARQLGDLTAAIRAEAAVGASLVTSAKMVGRLLHTIDVRHSHVLLDPQWLRMRQAIATALRGHPEAMRAVAAAMQAIEAEAARDITAAASKGGPPPLIEHDDAPEPPIIDVTPVGPPCPVPMPAVPPC